MGLKVVASEDLEAMGAMGAGAVAEKAVVVTTAAVAVDWVGPADLARAAMATVKGATWAEG